nr:MAG TPA: hypothetical protein [Bacteriophage sp.]
MFNKGFNRNDRRPTCRLTDYRRIKVSLPCFVPKLCGLTFDNCESVSVFANIGKRSTVS